MSERQTKRLTLEDLPRVMGQVLDRLERIEKLLEASNQPTQKETTRYLTVKEAAELLSLSVPTIYGLVSKAEIPVHKRGKRLYFSRQELLQWVHEGRKKTNAEIEEEAREYMNGKRGGGQ